MPKAEHKVPGGKLVRVDIQIKQSKISGIKISGDFFLHPEEDIAIIEQAVINMPIDEKRLTEKINDVLTEREIESVGVDAEAFARAIMKTIEVDSSQENKK
ncbi:MAG: lipoate protein ligase C-terminal domain-containing protein [Candidatus Ranarchaeia archaeon]